MDMAGLPPLGWPEFFGTWSLQPGWLIPLLLLGLAYLYGHRRADTTTTVGAWRVACFLGGLALTWVCVASAIGAYAMALTWMHMVLHLMLIMVVPVLLVLGHPLTVLLESFPEERRPAVRRVLRSWPVTLLLNPITGTLVYSVVIIGTHLTGFMDEMAMSPALMTGEQVLYIVAGYLFLVPIIGEEPIRSDPPYLTRISLLVLGMVPDTIVGIVMLQTNQNLYPMYTSMRPDWALDPVRDIQTAGALMWAGGDGGMMFIAVGLVIAVVVSEKRRARMLGGFLEGVRRQTLVDHVADSGAAAPEATSGAEFDTDGDEALAAYNRMLARLNEQEK